jgi:ABC-type nickel/cobalt efflux system permease component RcnA
MSRYDAIHEPFGDFPQEWDKHLEAISTTQNNWVRESMVLRMRAWMLWEQIGHQYVLAERAEAAAQAATDAANAHARAANDHAKAANDHAAALKHATWILAGATIGLFIATVGLLIADL